MSAQIRRRRLFAAGLALILMVTVVRAVTKSGGGGVEAGPSVGSASSTPDTSTDPAAGDTTSTDDTLATGPVVPPPGPPTTERTMSLLKTISGDISPKSVVASGRGQVFAQNMMYKHSVTAYGSDGELLKTIPDTVDLAAFGHPEYKGASYQGAPVEASFTPDGRYAYVSNYAMYGAGFGPEGTDSCTVSSKIDSSFLYRIDTQTLAIDQVIAVGRVPKYVAVTPDGTRVLVSNWCSMDLSVVDIASAKEVERIPLGPHPRGIAVAADSSVAYVAVMGGTDVAKIDLGDLSVGWIRGVGGAPRHLVLTPDGRTLLATLNRDGKVAKIDTTTGRVVARVSTGSAPRSMAISTDGLSVYVVNYESSTVSKIRIDDMKEMQTLPTQHHPIGITYDAHTGNVWVACYVGTIMVFADA
ncbi:MAG: YncE family protein [Acidimicrobiales bacterium]